MPMTSAPHDKASLSASNLAIGHVIAQQLRELSGRIAISEFSAEDIFVVAYPKSGSTWFQNLSAGIAFGVNPEHAPDSLIQELVPDVIYKQFYRRLGTPMFFKSHSLPRPEYRRVVYLLRDGRDVAVSHLHHRDALFLTRSSDEQRRGFVQSDAVDWTQHVNEWQRNPFHASMITIRYEDLLVDTPRELRRLCMFAGIERTDHSLRELAGQASFPKMQEKEARFGWDNPIWPKNKPFVRRGIAGSYRDELSTQLLHTFLNGATDTVTTLRKYGYAVD